MSVDTNELRTLAGDARASSFPLPAIRNAFDRAVAEALDESADEIDRLRGQWISVGDKLPKDGQPVLAFCAQTMQPPCVMVNCRSGWCVYPYFQAPYNVTHWMPLPEPPKQEKP